MTLKDIGESLRQERLRKSISSEEVMRRTKISRRNLEALEAGDVSELPHLVYVKGFVRTYAKVVGLDGEELAARVVEACGGSDDECRAGQPLEPESQQTVITGTTTGPPRSRKGLVIVLAMVVFLGGLGWLGYTLLNKGDLSFDKSGVVATDQTREQETTATTTAPHDEQGRMDTTAADNGATGTEDSANTPAAEKNAAVTGDSTDSGTAAVDVGVTESASTDAPDAEKATGSESAEQLAAAEATAQESATKAKKPAVPPQGHNLLIVAKEACWVESKADNEDMRDFYLRDGDKIRLRFQEQLRVRLGNAGGVTLTYDGKKFGLDAEKGQVKTLNFPISQ